MRVMIKIPAEYVPLLRVLSDTGDVKEVVDRLIDAAQQGVYRPGANERELVCQVFGYDWIKRMEPGDPYGRPNCEQIFQRPARRPGQLAQVPQRLIARGAA